MIGQIYPANFSKRLSICLRGFRTVSVCAYTSLTDGSTCASACLSLSHSSGELWTPSILVHLAGYYRDRIEFPLPCLVGFQHALCSGHQSKQSCRCSKLQDDILQFIQTSIGLTHVPGLLTMFMLCAECATSSVGAHARCRSRLQHTTPIWQLSEDAPCCMSVTPANLSRLHRLVLPVRPRSRMQPSTPS